MQTTTRPRQVGGSTRRAVLFALPTMALAAGCGRIDKAPPAPTVTLSVVDADWTGWSSDQPEADHGTEQVTEGSEFTRDSMVGELTFTVEAVDEDELTLRTSAPMSPRSEDGGIDLTTDQRTFSVAAGKTLEITTPTMDGGTTFEITYEE